MNKAQAILDLADKIEADYAKGEIELARAYLKAYSDITYDEDFAILTRIEELIAKRQIKSLGDFNRLALAQGNGKY